MLEFFNRPWPWYVSGPLLGLMVPLLLLLGNKQFGVSSSFRHICAAILPLKIGYFRYDWKSKAWNLVMLAGVIVGALLAVVFLGGNNMPDISSKALAMFRGWGLATYTALQPVDIFALRNLLSAPNLIMLTAGGFLVGFGTRYADGCTAGHSIMGLSLLNFGSLAATAGFFVGGLIVSNFLVPAILTMR